MFERLKTTIESCTMHTPTEERKALLQPLVDYIQQKMDNSETIRLNFICTHNSRRSHLAQIWAQTMAYLFNIKHVVCYSGGTEATAMFSKIAETLISQGFEIHKMTETINPVYAVKYAENELPIVCFSKTYNNTFNPKSNFGAVITCNHADEACPIVFGAEARFPIPYNDPKTYDGTDLQNEKYLERSLAIAQEMAWVFKSID